MTQPTYTVRIAAADDADAIARIYNQGIEERIGTFETEPRAAVSIMASLNQKGSRFPTVVVEQDNRPARSFYRRSGFLPVESELELFELVLPHTPN